MDEKTFLLFCLFGFCLNAAHNKCVLEEAQTEKCFSKIHKIHLYLQVRGGRKRFCGGSGEVPWLH